MSKFEKALCVEEQTVTLIHDALATDDERTFLIASARLPEALTPDDLVFLSSRIANRHGGNFLNRRALETDAIGTIGRAALSRHGDLVTAINAKNVIFRRFPIGTLQAVRLARRINEAEQEIIQNIIGI